MATDGSPFAAARHRPLLPAAQHRGTQTNGQRQHRPSSRPPSHRHPPPKKAGLPLPKTIARVISCAQRFHLRGGVPMTSFDARPAGNGLTRRTMIKTSAVLIGSCALGFTGVTSLGCSADNNGGGASSGESDQVTLHVDDQRFFINGGAAGTAFSGAALSLIPNLADGTIALCYRDGENPRSLLPDVGAAWVPCHRDGNAAHAQRRRRELRRRRFHPT